MCYKILLYFFIICTKFLDHPSCVYRHMRSWDSAVRKGTGLRPGQPRNLAAFATDARDLSLPRNVHNSCFARQASSRTAIRTTAFFPRHTRLSDWKGIFWKRSWDVFERWRIRQAQHSSRIELLFVHATVWINLINVHNHKHFMMKTLRPVPVNP